MTLPGDITTATLTFGPYTDARGDVQFAGMVGAIVPSSPVVDLATGAVVVSSPIPVVVGADGTASVSLPYTDQITVAPSPFEYTLTWQAGRYDPTPGNKTFALPVASGATVDFDLLGTASGSLVGAPLLPLVTSVNGQTGAVVVSGGTGGGAVDSVNGKTGIVTLSATDVGADASGAASAAQAYAIQRAHHTGTQAATTITGLATVATSGAYADLTGTPTIPTVTGTNTGDQTLTLNGSSLTISGAGGNSVTIPTSGGATVSDATTTAKGIVQLAGDLAGTAAAPTVAKINGAAPATVATSGSYTDLSSKPTIPTVGAAGAGATVALSSTDATVTNARTPTSHASTHAAAGADPITVAASQVTGLGSAALQPTSAFDAAGAAAAVLPAQTGNSGKFLTTNGTAVSWAVAGSGGTSVVDNGDGTATA